MSKTINTIKYGVIYSLILLAILALGAIAVMAREASAQSTYDTGYRGRMTVDSGNNNNDPLPNPTPSVDSIRPNSANLGSGAQTVTITGSGFVPNSVARWNGFDRPTTFIDFSHLLIYLSASDMYGSAGHYINVFNPAPNGGYSNAVLFTINGYVAPAATTGAVRNTGTGYGGSSSNSNATTSNGGSVLGAQTTNDSYSALASNVLYGSSGFMPSGIIQWLLLAIFILIIVIVVRKIFFADRYQSTPLKHS